MNSTYLRLEIQRVLRVPQLLVITVALPVVLFLVFSGLFDGRMAGVTSTAYMMQSMAAYGSLGAALYSASAIALERRIGWNRQLRLTPLPPVAYVVVKGLAAWLVTVPGLVLVYVAGAVRGVTMPLYQWAALAGATWTALLPFVLLAVGLGFVGTSESILAVTAFLILALSLLGGHVVPGRDPAGRRAGGGARAAGVLAQRGRTHGHGCHGVGLARAGGAPRLDRGVRGLRGRPLPRRRHSRLTGRPGRSTRCGSGPRS